MMRTIPSRRTTLQCSHSFLMEGRTFIASLVVSGSTRGFRPIRLHPGTAGRRQGRRLLEAVDDAAAGQVVGSHLHEDPVAGEDADEVLPHLSADARQHLVLVLELHLEDGVGQGFDHRGFELDGFFLAHAYSWKRVWSCSNTRLGSWSPLTAWKPGWRS